MGLLTRMMARAAATSEPAVKRPDSARTPTKAPPRATQASSAARTSSGTRGRSADPWVPQGQPVTLGGLTLHGGLLNVGPRLTSLSRWGGDEPDASLIVPTLKLNLRSPDDTGAGVGYWPSYSNLSPETRAGYLRWLAEGRNRPGGPIGFMFLYFYGLERRLLFDMHEAGTAEVERPALISEVRRLLELYGRSSGSVERYLSGLLVAVTPLGGPRRYLNAPAPSRVSWEMPFDTALGLGQLIADGLPIPADWAQAWWQSSSGSNVRTAVRRCPQEFAEVFAAMYAKQFGAGLVLRPNKAVLSWTYRPASPSIRDSISVTADVPDVRGLTAPVKKLAAIAEQATDSLAAYSRYVGKNPSRTASPQAVALLPPEVKREGNADTTALVAYAASMVEGYAERSVRLVQLTSRWGSPTFVKADAEALARLLERHAIGIEPDVRFGGPVPKSDSRVALFRRAPDLASAPSPAYLAVVSLVQLAGAVAAAGGPVREKETDTLIQHISHGAGLSADEQARLRAHLLWVSEHPPTPGALRKRVGLLSDQQKEQAARLIVAIAAADGQITPTAVAVIARLFIDLGFQETDAYAQIHALVTGQGVLRRHAARPVADPLASAKTSGQRSPGFALPTKPAPELVVPAPDPAAEQTEPVFILDPDLIAKTRQSTEDVAALLAGIFADEDADGPLAEPDTAEDDEDLGVAPEPGPGLVAGLDAAHSALLLVLAGRPTWSAADFADVCAEHALLPDGARDTLNEAALDSVGDLVCEGNDQIEMNSDALQEML